MRTIIDISDSQVRFLNQLSNDRKTSKASIIRTALNNYIDQYDKNKKSYEIAFGIWKNKNIDGLSYQRDLREEWNK